MSGQLGGVPGVVPPLPPKPHTSRAPSQAPAGRPGVTPQSGGTLSTFLRTDRDRYAVASSTTPTSPVVSSTRFPLTDMPGDDLLNTLANGSRFVSSYDGTSQYSSGGPSACGLAAMNAVRNVFQYHRKGCVNSDLLNAMNRQQFHEEVIHIASFLSEADHLEIDELHKLPLFARALNFVAGEYQDCSYPQFLKLLLQLQDRTENKVPVAAVITKSPEIIAVICIPVEPFISLESVYVIFDSHARPLHPNGSGLILFPAPGSAAFYLADLLKVDPSLLGQGDLQWQSEMLTTFSAHIFSPLVSHDAPKSPVGPSWTMLYETSADLVQAQGRLARMERETSDLRREAERLREESWMLEVNLDEAQASLRRSREQNSLLRENRTENQHLRSVSDTTAVNMTDEEYAMFWQSNGQVPPQNQDLTRQDRDRKGKGKARENPPSWAIGSSATLNDSHSVSNRNTQPTPFRRSSNPFSNGPPPSSEISHYHNRQGSVSLNDASALEARRLQNLDAQASKNHQLAVDLERSERHSSSLPPRPVNEQSQAPSTFASVSSFAGAVVGFVGNRLPTLSAASSTSANPAVSSSQANIRDAAERRAAKTDRSSMRPAHSPAASASNTYLELLKLQMEGDQEAKNLEVAWRIQQEEEAAVFPPVTARNGAISRAKASTSHLSRSKSRTKQQPSRSSLVVSEAPRPARPSSSARGSFADEDRQAALKLELEKENTRKTMALVRQLEEEERQTAELIASLGAQKTFECAICMDDKLFEDVASIPDCEHQFCRDCLRSFLGSELSSGSFPIMCPNCRAEKSSSPAVVPPALAELLGLSDKEYDQWSKLDLQRYSLVIDCPHCQTSSLVDKDDYNSSVIVTCPLHACRGQWCKDCTQRIDPSLGPHSCDGEKEMDTYIRMQNIKRCPGCKTPTEKTMGCNHMTCGAPACNTHFCYIDGDKIITSKVGPDIRAAIEKHYARCRLFDYT